MKIGKLITAKETILPLCQEKVSPKLAYKLMKFISSVETEEKFYHQQMVEIVSLYGEKDNQGHYVMIGDNIKIAEEKMQDCNNAIAALYDTEVDTPNITFSIEDFEEVKMSAKDIFAIVDFIKDK